MRGCAIQAEGAKHFAEHVLRNDGLALRTLDLSLNNLGWAGTECINEALQGGGPRGHGERRPRRAGARYHPWVPTPLGTYPP